MPHTTTYTATDWARADLWGPATPTPWRGRDLWWALAWLIGVNVAVAVPPLLYLQRNPEADPNAVIYSPYVLAGGMVGLWAVFLGYPLYITMVKGARSLSVDFGWRFRRTDALLGLGAGLLLRALDLGSSAVAGRFIDMSDGDNSNWLAIPRPIAWTIAFAVGAAVIAPALEELAFRGYLLRTIQRITFIPVRVRTAASILGSSVLFGALHTTGATAGGVYVAVVTGTIGVVLAGFTAKTGRLGLAVWTHIVFNTTGVIGALITG